MRRARTAGAGLVSAVALAAAVSTACTAASHPAAPETSTVVRTVTATRTPTIDPSPIAGGPTTSAAGTCPLLSVQNVADDAGMRLGRQSVQRSGGKVVGCRFYALDHPTAQCDAACLAGEKLPPADQPAVQITLEHYATPVAARNAMILRSRAGTGVQQVSVGKAGVGLAYQTEFYAADHGGDWACAFTVGTTLAVVQTVTVKTSFNAAAVATRLAGAL